MEFILNPNRTLISGVQHFYQATKPTARPDGSALVARDRWYKTDDGTEWFWNGTYWLGHLRDAQTSYFWAGLFALNNIAFVLPIEKVGCTSVLLKSIYATVNINTGNNVSNYYGFNFSIRSSTFIGSVNTSALSVGSSTSVFINSDPGFVLDVSTNARSAIFAFGQTIGTPGNTDFVSVGASYYPIYP